jgi:hypothetical protein
MSIRREGEAPLEERKDRVRRRESFSNHARAGRREEEREKEGIRGCESMLECRKKGERNTETKRKEKE